MYSPYGAGAYGSTLGTGYGGAYGSPMYGAAGGMYGGAFGALHSRGQAFGMQYSPHG